MAVVA